MWLASAAALVGVATGIFTLRDQIFQSNTEPIAPESVPYFDSVVSHFAESEDFIGFLQTHDGDAVRLQAGFQLALDDFSVKGFGEPTDSPDAVPRVGLYTECTPPLSTAEEKRFDLGFRDEVEFGRCFKNELRIDGPDTDDSGIYVTQSQPRLEGYFLVDIGDLHMGITPITLTPITFEEATERT